MIIAKALAKNADERYASIAEFAADLRVCRQQGAATTAPLAPAAAPQMIPDPTDPFADTLPSSRADDRSATIPGNGMADTPPARGLAKGFDSMAATMRLAAQTGAINDPETLAATFGVSRHDIDAMVIGADTQPPPQPLPLPQTAAPWSPRDRKVFRVSVTVAAAVGALILLL